MKHLFRFRHNLLKVHSRSGYVVLLPEVPPSSEALSKLNLANHDKLPTFSQLTTERCVTLMGHKIIEYETQALSIDEQINVDIQSIAPEEKSKSEQIFCKIFDKLESLNVQFDNTWSLLKHLYYTNKQVMPQNIYLGIHNRAMSARHKKYTLKNVYNACKTIEPGDLSEEQQRVLNKYLMECKFAGIELPEEAKSKLDDHNGLLFHRQKLFQLKLDAALKAYTMPINSLDLLPDAPPDLIHNMAVDKKDVTQGPWMVTLHNPVLSKFMEYCKNRDRRYQMWINEEKAASLQEEKKELCTSVVLEEIRRYRKVKAEILGYPSYLEFSMQTKMVGNIETLENILEEVRIKARLTQDTEVEALQQFIENKHPIQIWDVSYYSRLQKKHLFGYDELEWSNYFTLDNVLLTLFQLCNRLFDVQFEEKTDSVDKWNPNVRYYNIFDKSSSTPIAGFYVDPFQNDQKLFNSGSQVIGIRINSNVNIRVNPLSTLILNLAEPQYGKPCLLTLNQVEDLFFQFGSILQKSLTLTHYSDVSGVNNMEWDSVFIMNHFLTHWVYDETVFSQLNAHYVTGDKLPPVDLKSLRAHNAGIDICSELFKINLDLQIHGTDKFWADISRTLYPLHFGFPIDKYSNLPCRFREIASGDWAASYFCSFYAKIVSADIFNAFDKAAAAASGEEEDAHVEHRLRDTFLTFGGACHASETFRRFRGRDPCYKPFIDMFQLNRSEGNIDSSSN